MADIGDHLEHPVDVIRFEEGIRSRRTHVGERRLVETSGFDDAMVGEEVRSSYIMAVIDTQCQVLR